MSVMDAGSQRGLALNELPGLTSSYPLVDFPVSPYRVQPTPFPVEDYFDTLTWYRFFRHNFFLSLILSAIYIGGINVLQWYMKDRPPFKLKGPLIMWNLALAAFSILCTIRLLPLTLQELRDYGLYRVICMARLDDPLVGLWEVLFTASKILEFGDTLFLVLRKKPVIFLHWYHHATVLCYSWYAVAFDVAIKRLFACVNVAIHSVMYTYYALRAMDFKIPRGISMGITAAQLTQMVLGCLGTIFATIFRQTSGCDCDPMASFLALSMYGTYFILFWQFFQRAYGKRPAGARPKSQ